MWREKERSGRCTNGPYRILDAVEPETLQLYGVPLVHLAPGLQQKLIGSPCKRCISLPSCLLSPLVTLHLAVLQFLLVLIFFAIYLIRLEISDALRYITHTEAVSHWVIWVQPVQTRSRKFDRFSYLLIIWLVFSFYFPLGNSKLKIILFHTVVQYNIHTVYFFTYIFISFHIIYSRKRQTSNKKNIAICGPD